MNKNNIGRLLDLLIAIFAVSTGPVLAQEPRAQIVRLAPDTIHELPANLVKDLQRRGCTIPQETSAKKPNNIIKGQFAKRGQIDWAVLCSVEGVSTILVFWNGSAKNPASIAPMQDRIYIQAFKKYQFWYSRGIKAVGEDFIKLHHDGYGGPQPPPINHQGINDEFSEKGSTVWYFYNGRWLKLSGAD